MGISKNFISEYGHIDYYRLDIDTNTILYKNDIIGIIENDKTIYEIENPFDVAIIHDKREDMESIINNNPEHIKNWIIKIEDIAVVNFVLLRKLNFVLLNNLILYT